MATPRNRCTKVSRWGLSGALTAVLFVGVAAGCGGGSTQDAGSQSVGAADTTPSGSSTDTTPESEAAHSDSLNPIVNLCGVSELSEKASALYPDQHIKCIPAHGTPTSTHQVSNAAWSAGDINPRTYVITDEHTIQASIEGNQPDNESSAASFMYDGGCGSSTGVQCEDQEVEIEGTDCQMRTEIVELTGPTVKTWQVACYLGRDSNTGLDVRVRTGAVKLESAQGIEDFTAAVVRAARNE